MTLNQLIDNILLIARNSNVAESEHLSRIQIEKWIIAYRAMLLKQDIDKGYDIDSMYTTTIGPIHLNRIESIPGRFTYVSDTELPKLVSSHNNNGLCNVKDLFGNLIQVGDQTKAKYQKYRKATCNDYIAWLSNNRIYIQGDSNKLEYIQVEVVLEDPTEEQECFDPDSEFPIPSAKIPTITQLIMDNELKILTAMPSDTTNDSRDDLQNAYRK